MGRWTFKEVANFLEDRDVYSSISSYYYLVNYVSDILEPMLKEYDLDNLEFYYEITNSIILHFR